MIIEGLWAMGETPKWFLWSEEIQREGAASPKEDWTASENQIAVFRRLKPLIRVAAHLKSESVVVCLLTSSC